MKGAVQSKPSKASLVARGLAAKPLKGKRIVSKSRKVPDAKPGYHLYSTDSEDQASSVGRGLDRCATLLTNILDNDKGPKKNKESKPIKEKGKSTTAKTASSKIKAKENHAKPIVIPTASHKDQGPCTQFNERLVASTPILNPDERKRQQHLLEKEQELTRQLHQLKQHYELLQRQKSPEIQEQQKRSLQDSMLHELEEYQQNELESMHQMQSPSPSEGVPSARKSLSYRMSHDKSRIDSENDLRSKEQLNTSKGLHSSQQIVDTEEDTLNDRSHSSLFRPQSRQGNTVGPKKQVRVVSPDLSERYHPKPDSPQHEISPNQVQNLSLVSNKSEESVSPSAANNEVRTLQYLMKELREVIGTSDDLEVNRLLMEIDHTCNILPYLIAPSSPSKTQEDEDLHTKRLRLEIAHLKRKLQSATEKSQEQEHTIQNIEHIQSGQASVTFELAACRSENASLQKRLKEEKEKNDQLQRHLGNLEQVAETLREDKKKFVQILENKEHTFSKNRRSSQMETLKLSNEIRQLQAEVEAGKLSLEAAKKESDILNLSLKQKDAEIERLNQLTKALNSSMRRALGDIQGYNPCSSSGGPVEDKSNFSTLAGPRYEEMLKHDEILNDIKGSESRPGYTSRESIYNRHRDEGISSSQQTAGTLYTNSPFMLHSSLKQRLSLSPNKRTSNQSRSLLTTDDDPTFEFSPKASFGQGAWTETRDKSPELSSFSSRDEEDFQRDLANLDADIARIQKSLRETANRS